MDGFIIKPNYFLYSALSTILMHQTPLQFFLTAGKVNQETTGRLETLIKRTNDHLGEENCAKFDNIKWDKKGGTNEESLAEYLQEFGNMFEEKVIMLVERVRFQAIFIFSALMKLRMKGKF